MTSQEIVRITKEELINSGSDENIVAGESNTSSHDAIRIRKQDLSPEIIRISRRELKDHPATIQKRIQDQIRLFKKQPNYWMSDRQLREAIKLHNSPVRIKLTERVKDLFPRIKLGDLSLAKSFFSPVKGIVFNPTIEPLYRQYVKEQTEALKEAFQGESFTNEGMKNHKLQKYQGQVVSGKRIWSCVPASVLNGLDHLDRLNPNETEDTIITEFGGFEKFVDNTGMTMSPGTEEFAEPIERRGLTISFTSNLVEVARSVQKGNVALWVDGNHCKLISGIKSDGRNIAFIVNDPLRALPETTNATEVASKIIPYGEASFNLGLMEKDIIKIQFI